MGALVMARGNSCIVEHVGRDQGLRQDDVFGDHHRRADNLGLHLARHQAGDQQRADQRGQADEG